MFKDKRLESSISFSFWDETLFLFLKEKGFGCKRAFISPAYPLNHEKGAVYKVYAGKGSVLKVSI